MIVMTRDEFLSHPPKTVFSFATSTFPETFLGLMVKWRSFESNDFEYSCLIPEGRDIKDGYIIFPGTSHINIYSHTYGFMPDKDSKFLVWDKTEIATLITELRRFMK